MKKLIIITIMLFACSMAFGQRKAHSENRLTKTLLILEELYPPNGYSSLKYDDDYVFQLKLCLKSYNVEIAINKITNEYVVVVLRNGEYVHGYDPEALIRGIFKIENIQLDFNKKL